MSLPDPTRTAAAGLALALLLAAGCARTGAPSPEPEPRYEPRYAQPANLVEIVSEFQRLGREDVYRFDVPKDVTGTSILKATLLRLEDFERKHGNGYRDIVGFTRATAYERLRDYRRALRHYRGVARAGGELAEQARRQIDALETFQRIAATALPADDASDYIKALDERVRAWNALIERHAGTPLESLARVEAERVDRAKVAFVELNRRGLNDGDELVAVAYSELLSRHQESKKYHRHVLDFGDYYTGLAREYALLNEPEGLAFDIKTFEGFAQSAMKLYTEVAQQDGAPEKLEANGKIEGLKGMMEQMRRRSR
ncbi:MAG: hypothetical protein OXU42_03550 [Deltaproteobacteria bacterium]|nr:hypothetical protein [Deltaproteobacteria bacterium]